MTWSQTVKTARTLRRRQKDKKLSFIEECSVKLRSALSMFHPFKTQNFPLMTININKYRGSVNRNSFCPILQNVHLFPLVYRFHSSFSTVQPRIPPVYEENRKAGAGNAKCRGDKSLKFPPFLILILTKNKKTFLIIMVILLMIQ